MGGKARDCLCFSTAGVFPTVWAGLALHSPAGEAPTCPTWAVSPASVAAASQGKASLRLARDPTLPLQHVWGGSQGGGRDSTSHPFISPAANIQQRGQRRHQLQLQHHLQEPGPPPGLGPVNLSCLMELLLVKLIGNMSVRYVSQTCQSTCWVFCVVLQPPASR